MRPNKEFLSSLKSPLARFYLADLHVHSVGSADVCIGHRYERLPEELRRKLKNLEKEPPSLAQYDASISTSVSFDEFLGYLVKRRDAIIEAEGLSSTDNWAVVGITDHNVAEYAAGLSMHAWETRRANRLIVFPGLELDVTFSVSSSPCTVHVLCLFAPCTTASDIRMAIHDASGVNWSFGESLTISALNTFIAALRTHVHYPAICVAAHVASCKGVQRESKAVILDNVTAEIARIEGALSEGTAADVPELTARLEELKKQLQPEHGVDLEVLRIIGSCGFDGLQVADETDERHYRRLHRFRETHGRAIPIVCSDAHSPLDTFSCNSRIPFLKLSAPSFSTTARTFFEQVRDSALRFGETRTTCHAPGRVTHWIEGIEIVPDATGASHFWNDMRSAPGEPFVLALSRNLNCFIGGRGSGKSAAIEAAAFVSTPDQFAFGADNKKAQPDWYKRAAATLDGCSVRLCWKTTASDGYGALPKRATFATRYFNPKQTHGPVEYTDLEGRAVLDANARPPNVRIFRVHEIEAAAQPDRLRELFDDLCGPEISALQAEIALLRSTLAVQREQLIDLAAAINDLTQSNSPLRQFALRKYQFDEVDRAGIRDKYQRLDSAEAATQKIAATTESFGKVNALAQLQQLDDATRQFFEQARPTLVNESGDPIVGCEDAHSLLKSVADQTDSETILTASLSSARDSFNHFDNKLKGVEADATLAAQAIKEQMTKEGLPTGGKDRETKKQALQESQIALDRYRMLVKEFDELLEARTKIHASMVAKCKERTDVRKRTAERLTETRGRDLDNRILQIVVDAQPIADTNEYKIWLQQYLEPGFARYRPHRTEAILRRAIQPAELREFLLDPACSSNQILINEIKAEDGRISEEDTLGLREKCCARIKLAVEWVGGDLPDSIRDTLPVELTEGAWAFPEEKGKLRLDGVLQLDEVVFDDLPVITLNDRPADPASTLRPVHELSPGQRCSAILPILLLSGDAPVIIDQPEENLDNRLIRQVIVNILASMKLKRQVIIATHNPNLPVLGDCEQAIILQAVGHSESQVVATGDLESRDVTSYVTEIMEGGREAFQYRHSIYQTHWKGPVADSSN